MSETNNFVIHKHNTLNPHYDLHLELGEESKSWIIPNNIPSVTKEIKIAIESDSAHPDTNSKEVIEDAYGSGKIELLDQHYQSQWLF